VEELSRHLETGGLPYSRYPNSHENEVADRINVLWFQARVVPIVREQGHPPNERIEADVSLGINHLRSLMKLRFGMQQSQPGLSIATIERLVHLAHKLQILLRHRLPPLLGEAFGGGAGLVDVRSERHPDDQAIRPLGEASGALSNLAAAANWTASHEEHGKYESMAEV
jgi:hypothetical protein